MTVNKMMMMTKMKMTKRKPFWHLQSVCADLNNLGPGAHQVHASDDEDDSDDSDSYDDSDNNHDGSLHPSDDNEDDNGENNFLQMTRWSTRD